jgi:hypothetical protein
MEKSLDGTVYKSGGRTEMPELPYVKMYLSRYWNKLRDLPNIDTLRDDYRGVHQIFLGHIAQYINTIANEEECNKVRKLFYINIEKPGQHNGNNIGKGVIIGRTNYHGGVFDKCELNQSDLEQIIEIHPNHKPNLILQ